MKLYSYEMCCKNKYDRKEYVYGIVQHKNKKKAKKYVEYLYAEDTEIKWIELYELFFDNEDYRAIKIFSYCNE